MSGSAAESDRVPAPLRSLTEEPAARGPARHARTGEQIRGLGRAPAVSERRRQPREDDGEAKLSVGFILLHEFTLFAFSGFVDALRIAGDDFDNSRQRECRWTVIAPTLQPVRANCGVEIAPWETFPDPAQFDYVVVIGGRMEPQRNTDPRIIDYLRLAAERGRRDHRRLHGDVRAGARRCDEGPPLLRALERPLRLRRGVSGAAQSSPTRSSSRTATASPARAGNRPPTWRCT